MSDKERKVKERKLWLLYKILKEEQRSEHEEYRIEREEARLLALRDVQKLNRNQAELNHKSQQKIQKLKKWII